MGDPFTQAKNIYLDAQKNFEAEKVDKCAELLRDLKIALIRCTEFLPSGGIAPTTKEHALTRDSLELGVLHAVQVRDINAFERYMVQLKPYYQDFKNTRINESPYAEQMIGLYLLFLLAKNRVGEFHAELEKLPSDKIESSHYLQHPVQLEQCLMEGNYSKVFLARSNIPAPQYQFFMEALVTTIRSEIADCMEISFTSKSCLPADEVARLLHFTQVNAEFQTFVNARTNWTVTGNGVVKFSRSKSTRCANEESTGSNDFDEVDPKDTTRSMIDYAKEMEVII